MIKFCVICDQHWNDRVLEECFLLDWFYCTIDGYELKNCPACDKLIENTAEIIEDEESGYEEKDTVDESCDNKI